MARSFRKRSVDTTLLAKDDPGTTLLPEEMNDYFDAKETEEDLDARQREWELFEPGPYLRYVKQLTRTLPHLQYLGHWMEVSAASSKWNYLKEHPENRGERASRVKVSIIEFGNDTPTRSTEYTTVHELQNALMTSPEISQLAARLVVCEDVSRDLIETIGSFYNIDPLFFLSHIGDYLFHAPRHSWIDTPSLGPSEGSDYFTLRYLRARYFKTEEEFTDAERQNEEFNVLRRLDSDKSRRRLRDGLTNAENSVAISRAKTSLWIKTHKQDEAIIAVLLVDPTVTAGHPVLHGFRIFDETPSWKTWQTDVQRPSEHVQRARNSLLGEVVYWSLKMSQHDLSSIQRDAKCIAIPMFRLVIADWLAALRYMTTMLRQLEWEFEKPHWGEEPSDIDHVLKSLSPWRRNIGYYLAMINENIARLFPVDTTATSSPYLSGDQKYSGILDLWDDFRNIRQKMNEVQARINSIEAVATAAINVEESRRAVREARSLRSLTVLSTIFIPLSFAASFISVTVDASSALSMLGMYVKVAIPLTLISLLAWYWFFRLDSRTR